MFRHMAHAGTFVSKLLSPAPFLLICAVPLLLPNVVYATTVAGRTNGSFAVSPTGAATYTIPIWAPPGPQGLQPHIALTYNSQSGIGPVGVGWSIGGLSAIYRCNLTFAQDAAPAPVTLTTSDGLCLDGQRLRLTGGTYGTAGSTYQTETANFANVTANGTAGNGPAYFVAQGRDGRTYTYGNTTDSQVVATGTSTALSWQLNEVSDRASNTMLIAYNQATGSAVPAKISWTPSSHGSGTYNYTMTFAYGANVPQSSIYGYAAGTQVQNTNLLSAITVAYTGTVVKKYVLGYQQAPTTTGTGRNRLIQVQECSDSAGTNCLLPTAITYQNGTAGVSTSGTTAVSAASGSVLANYDLNGNGYKDLIYKNGSNWYVAFGSSSGYGTPVSTGISSSTAILPGDFLGTGQDGLLANNGGTWYYYTWNGSSFTGSSTGLAYDSAGTQFLTADIDGDGRSDLIELVLTVNVGYTIYTRLNTSSSTSVSFSTTRVTALSSSDVNVVSASIDSGSNGTTTLGTLRRLDFNGDGRDDIALHFHDKIPNGQGGFINLYSENELLSNGSTFSAFNISGGDVNVSVAFLDWNSDACTDYMVGTVIAVSGCNGSVPTTVGLGTTLSVIGAMDWDGDGRTDILVANGSTIGVLLSTGNGVGSLVSTSVPYGNSNFYFTLEPAGDGLDALGYYPVTSGAVAYYKHNGAGQPADLLSSATDGFGNSVTPTYVSIVQNNYTKTGYGTPTFPYKTFLDPLYVVNEAVFSDPSSSSGGTYNQTFTYYEAYINLQGRGFQAFYNVSAVDSRTGLISAAEYQRTFPGTGMLLESYLQQASPLLNLSVTENTLTTNELSSTQHQERYFPYVSNSTIYTREFGGAENGDLITTTSTNYTFDNYGNATQVARTVTDNDPGWPTTNPYNGKSWTATTTNTPDVDTTNWCLGLFTKTQVAYTSTLSGSNPVTRTRTYTPDTTNCRYTEIVTEPNSSQFKVTEDLTYDSFGNIATDKITGVNMASRTTTLNWTSSTVTTGQLPMSVTDPTNATTQFNYNFSYGLKSSATDPNNVTTSWQYTDGFGRKTQETRPDGTYTKWTYQNCAGGSGCLVGSNGLVVSRTVYNTDNSTQSSGTTYLDSIDRTLVSNQVMLNGGFSRNEKRYDSLGNVHQLAFPCTWSSLSTTCTYWTTNTYDVLHRLTQSQRPISSTNGTLQTTTYAYAGRTTTVTDPQSNAKTTVTDVNGWYRQTKDAYGYTVTLAYDAAGSKTAVTDSLGNSLGSATYNYGIGAFPATVNDMDMGNWVLTYDALAEKTGWTDAKNQSFGESYDALSRPQTRSEPDYFTQWTWGSSASSHNLGKLQSVCTGLGNNPTNCTGSPGYSESETYDNLGRTSTRAIGIPGQSETFTYTWAYNPTTGLLNTLTYPASYPTTYSFEVQYGYSNGILQTVTDISDTPNVTVWTANTTNPAGQITQQTLGNGVVTNRSYDAVTSWLMSVQSGVGGGSALQNQSFLYDEMGNLTQRQGNNIGLTENIYYDNDYRLSYTKLNGTQNLSLTYDSMGDITSRSDVAGGATWTYSSTQKHAVTQAGSSAYVYAYDANGNANSRQGSNITWSSYNYPTAIAAGSGSTAETVGLSYGPDRLRWQQSYTGNGTTETTDYIGGLLDFVASGGVLDYRHYIYAAGEAVAVYSRKNSGMNTWTYKLSDHQSGVASFTNSSGASVVGESFTPFGSRRNTSTWSGPPSTSELTTAAGISRQAYTFQTQLGLWMGMNHMNGRVQDAVTGRMLSADPNIPDPTNAQNYNRFSYVNNNPLTYTDPSGFQDQPKGAYHLINKDNLFGTGNYGANNSFIPGAMYNVSGIEADTAAARASAGSGSSTGSAGASDGQISGTSQGESQAAQSDQGPGTADQGSAPANAGNQPQRGFDPTTGDLTPEAQAALSQWDGALEDTAADAAAGNYTQRTFDEQSAAWARANYYYMTGSGPFPGPPPTAPPAPLPEPQLTPIAPITLTPPTSP